MINSITATELTTNQKKLFEYVITYDDGTALKEKQKLAAHDSDKYKVTVRYKDDISSTDLSTTNTTIDIEIHVEYVQADNTAINRVKNSFISIYNQATPGVLAQGDEVNIGDEHFYIISEDTNKYVLRSKYNLNVGDYLVPGGIVGVQNKKAIGSGYSDVEKRYGAVHFSNIKYWTDASGVLYDTYKVTHDYAVEVYDSLKNSNSGDEYSIAYYVNSYSNYLTSTYSAFISKSRLMSYNEARRLGYGTNGVCDNAPLYVRNISYWLSSSFNRDVYSYVWNINYNSRFGYGNIYNNNGGVRPVIEVSKQYL